MKLEIIENRYLSGKDFFLKVKVPSEELVNVKPGQFAMVRVCEDNQTDPLLRRPLGIFDIDENSMSFIYRVVGRGTELLSNRKNFVDVIFPFGNYFENNREKYLFIAGGIGIGGVFLAAKQFANAGKDVVLIYGGRTKEDLSAVEFTQKYNLKTIYVTEDGSFGEKGLVTDYLEGFEEFTWAACGPKGMLKAVKSIAAEKGVECLLSIDTRMACGVGSCLGCVVKTKDGYLRACKEGPIFNADYIEL